MDIESIFRLLENTPSKNKKIEILKEHEDNVVLKNLIEYALNPFKSYYIKKTPTIETYSANSSLEHSFSVLDSILSRDLSGHAALKALSDEMSSLSENEAEILKRVVKKDLRCGVAEGIIDKVWPGLIPSYPCLLCSQLSEKTKKHIKYPAYAQLKSDGMRVNILCEFKNGKYAVSLYSRAGREIDIHGVFFDEFSALRKKASTDIVFDGELIVIDPNTNTVMSRKKGNGILNKAIKGTISKKECDLVRVQLWDMLDKDSFVSAKKIQIKYKDRLANLNSLINEDCKKCSVIPTVVVNSFEEAQDQYEKQLFQGNEGIILKNFDSFWEDKRSNELIKFKSEKECDLEIVGFNYGSEGTKLEGKLGSLICASSDRSVLVNISGFTDKKRQEYFDNIHDLIGKIVTIVYNERISSDSNEQDSLFLPRIDEVKGIRTDKFVADSSEEIK